MFLETVQRSLAHTKSILQVKGGRQAARVVPALLSDGRGSSPSSLKQEKEKGAEILRTLARRNQAPSSFILPSWSDAEAPRETEDKAQRQKIFYTLLK